MPRNIHIPFLSPLPSLLIPCPKVRNISKEISIVGEKTIKILQKDD